MLGPESPDAGTGTLHTKVDEIDLKLTALIAGLDKTDEVEAAVEGRLPDPRPPTPSPRTPNPPPRRADPQPNRSPRPRSPTRGPNRPRQTRPRSTPEAKARRRARTGDDPLLTSLGMVVAALLIFSLTGNQRQTSRLEDTAATGLAAVDERGAWRPRSTPST